MASAERVKGARPCELLCNAAMTIALSAGAAMSEWAGRRGAAAVAPWPRGAGSTAARLRPPHLAAVCRRREAAASSCAFRPTECGG